MKANILSRKDQVNTKENNKDVWLLKEELWTRKTTVEVIMLKKTTTMDKLKILEEIKRNNTREREMVQVLEKDDRLSWEQDGIVYMEKRIYILNNKKLKKMILQENHDSVDMGHPGQQRIMELLKWNYWWPSLKEDVKKYVQDCFKCQQNKV